MLSEIARETWREIETFYRKGHWWLDVMGNVHIRLNNYYVMYVKFIYIDMYVWGWVFLGVFA